MVEKLTFDSLWIFKFGSVQIYHVCNLVVNGRISACEAIAKIYSAYGNSITCFPAFP